MDKTTSQQAIDALPPTVFRGVVEAAPSAVSITDSQGRILYVNASFSRITGYSASEVLGANPSILSYKVTPREVYLGLWSAISQGQAWHGRLVNRRKNGERYIAELTITPIRNELGKVCYFLGLHQDVSELHAMNERLQNQKRLTESIVDLAPVAVVLLDEKEQVVLDNQEYKKLMGSFGKREPAHAMLEALRAEMGGATVKKLLQHSGFNNRMLRFDRAGSQGPSWYAVSATGFSQNKSDVDHYFDQVTHRYVLLAISDITPLKRQQQNEWLQALRTMLSEGELVHRLRETLSGAAYQLAGPLNVIAAAEKQLARRLPACDAALEALGQARQQGEAALQLLSTAAPAMPPEAWMPVNCNELMHDVLRLLTDRLLAEGISVQWTPALRLPSVSAQALALRSAFAQLINNAIDALHESRSKQREIHLTSRETSEGVELEICDSGPGIPEALRIKVFEPFFTTRRSGARAGMGLTMAQETIQRHQGSLEFDSAYQNGCRVVVHLPSEAHHG